MTLFKEIKSKQATEKVNNSSKFKKLNSFLIKKILIFVAKHVVNAFICALILKFVFKIQI